MSNDNEYQYSIKCYLCEKLSCEPIAEYNGNEDPYLHGWTSGTIAGEEGGWICKKHVDELKNVVP